MTNSRMIRALSIAVAVFYGALSAAAQSFTVSGVVSSAQGPEPFVMVYTSASSTKGSVTDADGRYSIVVPDKESSLTFALLGFKTITVPVAGRSTLDVLLEEDSSMLKDAVVIGYSEQKRELVIGSVSQVSSRDILKAPTTNVSTLLAGRLSGVSSIQTTGIPGDDSAKMLVRGYSTFNDSSPLILVDGVERNFNFVNPNDIESVTVLKDAASAAIYGVRGGNGVILVTTKSGSSGYARISYDGSYSFDTNTAMPELCDADQFIYYHNKARELDGQLPLWTPENIQKLKDMGLYGETDFLKEIYNRFGLTAQHNISASGGTESIKYYASIGYLDQTGILKSTDYSRFNVRGNIEAALAKGLKYSLNLSAYTTDRNKPGYSIAPVSEFSPITSALFAIPILKPAAPDGTPLAFKNGSYYRYPQAQLTDSGYQNQKRYNFEGTTKLSYSFDDSTFLKGLVVSMFGAYNYGHTADYNLMTPFKVYYFQPGDIMDGSKDLALTEAVSQGISQMNYNRSSSMSWNLTLRPQIDYNRTFGKHSIGAFVIAEAFKGFSETMTAFADGFYVNDPLDISLGMNKTTPPSGSHSNRATFGVAGKASYAYDGKYLAEASLRADCSYKFAPQNRWGYFPSVSLGWIISREDFMDSASDVVDFLKVRVSAGKLGCDDTSEWLYKQLLGVTNNAVVMGGSAQSAFYSMGYVHDNLTWSHVNAYNAGLEGRFFGNKLSADLDVFYKLTDRILELDNIGTYSPSLGGNYPTWMNTGKVDNRGVELTLRHDNWFANGLTYAVTGIVSYSHNRVLSKRIIDDHPSYRQIIGQPIGTIYGFHVTGKYQTQKDIDTAPAAPSGYKELGALMYEDVNGDGIISSAYDYVKIGRSPTPELTFSLGGEVGWKNFHLSVLFQGAALCNYSLSGAYNNTTDNTLFTRAFYGNGNSVLYLVEDAWTPDNTGAKYPRLSQNINANNAWASDMWVVNGSYLRLKNLQLSYDLPKNLIDKLKLNSASVFIGGTNLFTLCEFKYLDPENPGINNGYYPVQRTVSTGLKLQF